MLVIFFNFYTWLRAKCNFRDPYKCSHSFIPVVIIILKDSGADVEPFSNALRFPVNTISKPVWVFSWTNSSVKLSPKPKCGRVTCPLTNIIYTRLRFCWRGTRGLSKNFGTNRDDEKNQKENHFCNKIFRKIFIWLQNRKKCIKTATKGVRCF